MNNDDPYELVIAHQTWDRAVRSLTLSSRLLAAGACQRNRHPQACELLVNELKTADDLPTGDQRPPLSENAVVLVSTNEQTHDAATWIRRLQPRSSQLLAVCVVGLGERREQWDGLVAHAGRVTPLSALRIVGPGMVRAERDAAIPADPQTATLAAQRWSRTQGALGVDVCAKIARSSILLLGAGRNGSAMAHQLAALGVRSLTIIDPDRLELANLDAAFCMTEADIGRAKARALQERLLAFRSDFAVTSLCQSASHPQTVEQARNADLIVSCVDNDTPRLAAALLARRFLKVHMDVGTGVLPEDRERGEFAGDARLLLPRRGCVCCVGGLQDQASARKELAAPPGALRPQNSAPWHALRAGSLITLNAITVSVGVQMWIDLLAGHLQTSHWHRLVWRRDRGGLAADYGSVGPSPDCDICQGKPWYG